MATSKIIDQGPWERDVASPTRQLPGMPAGIIDTYNAGNLARIPRGAELEGMSSDRIAELLNPPAMFADTDRQAAELGAGRGVPGSASAFGVGLRLTDEERLKRIGQGEQDR